MDQDKVVQIAAAAVAGTAVTATTGLVTGTTVAVVTYTAVGKIQAQRSSRAETTSTDDD